jgi:hypothetical protein
MCTLRTLEDATSPNITAFGKGQQQQQQQEAQGQTLSSCDVITAPTSLANSSGGF